MTLLTNIWVVLWIVLGLIVVGLAMYRRMVASHEDDVVHVTSGENRVIDAQISTAQRIDKIDFWGKTLTIALIAYGLILGAYMLYQTWEQTSKLSG